LEKTATIYSNDPQKPVVVVTIKAQVQQMISISPPMLSLIGLKGENVNGEVEITTAMDRPLVLQPDSFSLLEKMSYTLVEVEKGKKFIVRFQSTIPLSEALNGYLNLHTNYTEKPEITIFIQCGVVSQNN
jgi:hypothetical protein